METTKLPTAPIPRQKTQQQKFILVEERTIMLALELYQSTLEKTGRQDIAISVVMSAMFDP